MTSAFIFLRSWVAETVEMTEMPLDLRGFGCNQAKPSITASKRGSHHYCPGQTNTASCKPISLIPHANHSGGKFSN